jgi:DNA-binding NarL/FixJ family response regulator
MRVLLADDQVWLRSALRLLLEHEPMTEVVGEVGSTSTLLELTAQLLPDVIVLDWDLPELKFRGARQQLIAKLRALQPQLSIIALSTDPQSAAPLSPVNADCFVSKAEPPRYLLAALRQVAKPVAGEPAYH